jgi:hypothetical protein
VADPQLPFREIYNASGREKQTFDDTSSTFEAKRTRALLGRRGKIRTPAREQLAVHPDSNKHGKRTKSSQQTIGDDEKKAINNRRGEGGTWARTLAAGRVCSPAPVKNGEGCRRSSSSSDWHLGGEEGRGKGKGNGRARDIGGKCNVVGRGRVKMGARRVEEKAALVKYGEIWR